MNGWASGLMGISSDVALDIGMMSDGETLGGTIHLTLRESDTPEDRLSIYTYDVAKKELQKKISDPVYHFFTNKLSPDGAQMVLASANEETREINLFIRNQESGDMEQLFVDTNITYKQSPEWSPDNKSILFAGRTDAKDVELDPEKWGIYLYNLSTG